MRAKMIVSGIGLALALAATPALARHKHRMDYPAYPANYLPQVQAAFPVDRALAERCGLHAGSMRPHVLPAWYHDRHGRRDDGLGGALLGGAVGGLVGNRVAGRGDRLLGTAAGVAVGALAGAAIDRAEDGRTIARPPSDYAPAVGNAECDAVLPAGYMLISVPGGQECRDEVVTREEWVPEYETIPGRIIYERAPPRDKRTKLRRVK
jgi:uncharacterized protein YcfJ